MSTALPGVQERTHRRGVVRRVVVLLACVVVAWFAYRFAASSSGARRP